MSETIPKCRTCKTEIKWHEPMKIVNNKCYCQFCHKKGRERMSRLEEIKRLWEENNDFPVDPAEYEWLISRVEELEEENKRYKQALEFYADEINNSLGANFPKVVSKVGADNGEAARQALKGEHE